MSDLTQIGRVLIVGGLVLAAAGALILLAGRVPFLGRLPGDLTFRRDPLTIYAHLVTSALLSILLTVVINLLWRR